MDEPTGAPRPLLKQIIDDCAPLKIRFTGTLDATLALNTRAPSICMGILFSFAKEETCSEKYEVIVSH